MSKHTPGPWFIDYEGGGAMGRRAMLENENGECVGYLYEAQFQDEILIATAPELLAALRAMLACCYDIEKDIETEDAVEAARKAIAKATGEKV